MIVGAAVLWGMIGPFSVWATRAGLQASEIAFWRAAIASLPFVLLALPNWPRPNLASILGVLFFGATGIATMYGAFFNAVERTGPGIAAVLLYTGPAWVAVFEWIAARERPDSLSVVALLLTITGVVMLSLGSGDANVNAGGIMFGLLSGIAFSTHFTVAPRYINMLGAPFVYALAMATAAILLAVVAQPSLPAQDAWPPLLFLTVFSTVGASLLFARGIVRVAPVRAAITSTIEPVVATVLSILLLNAVLGMRQIAGAVLVIAGVLLIMMRGSR